jgi:hypothetical protein
VMASRRPDDLDEFLSRAFRILITDLAESLDLEAGEIDMHHPRELARLRGDLTATLDLDAGLARITGGPIGDSGGSAPPRDTVRTAQSWVWNLMTQLGELSPAARIELRRIGVAPALGDSLNLAREVTRTHARILGYIFSLAGPGPRRPKVRRRGDGPALQVNNTPERSVREDLARTHELLDRLAARLDSDRVNVDQLLQLGHQLEEDLAAANARARTLTRGLHRSTQLTELSLALARALVRARQLVDTLAAALLQVLGCEPGVEPDLRRTPAAEVELLMALLESITNDFVGADLRTTSLEGVPLQRIRWSASTRWPVEWLAEVLSTSIEIAPGIFEIGGWSHRAENPVST